ncbi:MAG: 16S rRNA (adenine(1518)-N(6)/adenine(1519)-N(6))-dimethyltransferase RsmA [Verrucomicrobiota bacterium]
MPLLNLTSTKAILETMGHSPQKKLGQNFLVDANITRKSLALAQVQAKDRIVEIGPGLGTLTRALLETGAHVYAVERDPTLYSYLKREIAPHHSNLSLMYGDAVEHPLAQIKPEHGPFKIVANLPYAITSPWMDAVLEHDLPTVLSLMLQEEAADRLCAKPGTKSIGALTIDVALAFEKVGLHRVPAQCFYPPPAVGSVLLVLKKREQPHRLSKTTRSTIRFCFTQRRKQIGALLRKCPEPVISENAHGLLNETRIDPTTRPEAVTVHQWRTFDRLVDRLKLPD